MKKIRLKNLKLEASEMLGRNQLKTGLGGYQYNGGCAYQGGNGYYGVVSKDMSAYHAQWGASLTGGHWRCDSCCSASWITYSMKQELGC